MSTLDRLERANPVADADRLLSAPGAMDDFILAAKERSGIVQIAEDRAPIEVPTETRTGPPPSKEWRRRLVPALLAAAAVIAAIVVAVVLLGGDDDSVPDVGSEPLTPFTGATHGGPGVLWVGNFSNQVGFDGRPFPEFAAALLDEAAGRIGLSVVIPNAGYLTARSAFDEHDVLSSGLVTLAQPDHYALFTAPIYRPQLAVVVDPETRPDISGMADLGEGDLVSTTKFPGFPTDVWVRQQLEPMGVGFLNLEDPTRFLESGDAAAWIEDLAFVERQLAAHPNLEIVEVLDPGYEFGLEVDPENPELRAALDTAIQAVIADNTYQQIYDLFYDYPEGSVAP